MKLPNALGDLLGKKQPKKEIFASLLLDKNYVAASLWEMGEKGIPNTLASDVMDVREDSWEARTDAVDTVLSDIEQKAGITDYTKIVLGFPLAYLTPEGDITQSVRPEVKKLTKEMELTPIGFVSIHQALMYLLKKEEGVPPSVILLGVTDDSLSLSLYKVGALTGQTTAQKNQDVAIVVEEMLKEFKYLEVLPARILLYGKDGKNLEEIKSELLRYPWTTRVNFLHFPKIEIIKPIDVVSAVSLAGASELAHEMSPYAEASGDEGVDDVIEKNEEIAEETIAAEAMAPTPTVDDVELDANTDEEMLTAQAEVEEAQDIEEGEGIQEEESFQTQEEESNVMVVDPAALGFQKNVDVLETPQVESEEVRPARRKLGFALPALPAFSLASMPKLSLPKSKAMPIAVLGIGVVILFAVLYWFVPHATVSIFTLPKALVASEQITIDPTSSVVDAQNNIIPGHTQEKSVNGEKTVPVTGKKKVGEPAKGPITIYNKTSSVQTLKKGTIFTSDSLQFTLDADTTIPAATVTGTLGSETKTFGQSTAALTAGAIGAESNIASGKTLSVKGFSTSEMIANNTQAFSGGTSRDVTVVTRADLDNFIKTVSDGLVEQAKADLTSSVNGSEKLIDATVKTTVTEKTFSQELDQEATELTGKLTITVSGISYSEDDAKTMLQTVIINDVPAGYKLADGRTNVTIENVQVKKDGKITAKATIHADAVPTIDAVDIQGRLAGKKLHDAEAYLRSISGIASVEFAFRMSFTRDRLPMNKKNIVVSVGIQ